MFFKAKYRADVAIIWFCKVIHVYFYTRRLSSEDITQENGNRGCLWLW